MVASRLHFTFALGFTSWFGSTGCAGRDEPAAPASDQTTNSQNTSSAAVTIGSGATTGDASTTTGASVVTTMGANGVGVGSPSTSGGPTSETNNAATSSATTGAVTSTSGVGGSGSTASSTGIGGGATGGGNGGASTTTGATGAGGTSTGGEFELSWVDEFDTVDTSRWQLMTHTWDGNLAQFATTTVEANGGILSLKLVDAPAGSEKPYLGVEYRSIDTLTYGKVEARARFAKGSAVVSSLVTIYTPWPPDDWNELDIECLGKTTGQVQFNHMINIPPADPETGHLQYPELVDLGFDPTADFHDYAVEWVPGEARFLVDGQVVYVATEEMSRMVLPQNILLTIWASDAADWAGLVDGTTSPTSAQYDWIRVYRHVGQ